MNTFTLFGCQLLNLDALEQNRAVSFMNEPKAEITTPGYVKAIHKIGRI